VIDLKDVVKEELHEAAAVRPLREGLPDAEKRIEALVPARRAGKRVAWTVFGTLLGVGLVLKFTPWQQTVIGNGQVQPFDVSARPQTVDAQIGGRLREWRVQEGQTVKKGQLIALIEDTDSSFLSPERLRQVNERLAAQRQRRAREVQRAARIRERIKNLALSQPQQVAIAKRQKAQAENAARVAGQNVKLAENSLDAAVKVARVQAQQRLAQAKITVDQARDQEVQARQTITDDENALKFQSYQTKRMVELAGQGLRSGRDKEIELTRQVTAEQKLARSKKSLEIAQKEIRRRLQEVEAVKATNVLADIDVMRARNSLEARRADLLTAQQQIANSEDRILQVDNDSAAPIRQAEGDLQSVEAGIAAIDDSIAAAEQQRDNMNARVGQQKIFAPVSGRISRVGKTLGPGQTVKKDDDLCEIVPETTDQAVALFINEADASLVSRGRKVRIQFNGFPAVQVSGFPQAAVGTFSGVVTNIDPDSGGKGVRLQVKPDSEGIAGRLEKPWPQTRLLRPGTGAVGWVLLEKVPLWYELWRQFNAFPPEFRDLVETDTGKGKEGSTKAKAPKDGDVKLPKR
jgi:membrane fusion protein, adhesin transport system